MKEILLNKSVRVRREKREERREKREERRRRRGRIYEESNP